MPSDSEPILFSVAPDAKQAPRTRSGRPEAFPRYGEARRRAAEGVAEPASAPLDDQQISDTGARERMYRRCLAAADAFAAVGCVAVVLSVIGGDQLKPLFLLVVPVIVLIAKMQGLYDRDELVIHKSTLSEFPRLLNLATLLTLLLWITRKGWVSGSPRTLYLFGLWMLLLAALTTFRALARALAAAHSPDERLLLVGSESVRRRVAAKLADRPRTELVGAMTIEDIAKDPQALRRTATLLSAQRVLIALSDHGDAEETMDVVRCAMASGLGVSLLPSSLGVVGSSVAFDDLGGMPLLGVPRFGLSRSSRAIKRAFDLAGASIAALAAAPVLLAAAVAIKRSSPGPILFRQTRVGRDGRHFTMLKLRTMVDGADAMKEDLLHRNEAADGLFKISDDPRITSVGRFLRRTSLDELPQLFNVLRGDMSLVGPRPLVLDEDKRVTGYDRRRLHLTPGMTGRWQTLGSARIPLSEMVKIDYLYVANWSLWADIKIMLETVGFVASRRGL